MKLYYTNISGEEIPQTRPDLSLGGFKSSTIVPNNSFSNVFSDISLYSISENRDEYTALVLHNDTGGTTTDVTLYFDYPVEGSQKAIEFAFVAFNVNGEIEVIPNPYSQPYNATFQGADGVANAVNIGNILDDGKIGIWFKKIIDKTAIETEYSNANMEESGTPEEANEDITLNVSWT